MNGQKPTMRLSDFPLDAHSLAMTTGCMDDNIGLLVGPTQKYFHSCWMHCHEIWQKHPWRQEDESIRLVIP